MRLLEILLIVGSLLLIFHSFSVVRVTSRSLILVAVVLLLLAAHFVFEGARWQMGLVYLVVVSLCVVSASGIRFSYKASKWFLFTVSILCVLLSSGLSYLLPVFTLPPTTGTYNIFATQDVTQHDLKYKVWFPSKQVPYRDRGAYHSNPTEDLKGVMGMPGFVFGHLELVKTNAYVLEETVLENTKSMPLVIYSHGSNGTMVDNSALMEELASYGYVIVAIDHGFSFERYGLDLNEAKKIEVSTQKKLINDLIEKAVPNQVADLEKVIEELKTLYTEQIDFDQMVLIGHSLGGTTATSAGLEIEEAKGVINMDGPIDPQVTSNYPLPLLYFSSFSPHLSDEELTKLRVPPHFYRNVKKYELTAVEALFDNNTKEKYWVRSKNANHLDYTDIPYFIPAMSSPAYDKKVGQESKAKIILSFLDRVLHESDQKVDFSHHSIDWVATTTNDKKKN